MDETKTNIGDAQSSIVSESGLMVESLLRSSSRLSESRYRMMLQKLSSYNLRRKNRGTTVSTLSAVLEAGAQAHIIPTEDPLQLNDREEEESFASSSQISRPNSCDSSLVRESQIRRISSGGGCLISPEKSIAANKHTHTSKMMSVMRRRGGEHGAGAGTDDSEIFLRNPKTGGFDYTPGAQYGGGGRPVGVPGGAGGGVRFYNDQEGLLQGDQLTLNDSTIYTSYTEQPLLPQKQREITSSSGGTEAVNQDKKKGNGSNPMQSFQRYFHMKATKIPNSTLHSPPPEQRGGADMASMIPVVSPSPSGASETTNGSSTFSTRSSRLLPKKLKNSSFLQQFKSSLRISSSTLTSGGGGGGSPSRNDGHHAGTGRGERTDEDDHLLERRGNQRLGRRGRPRRSTSRSSSQSSGRSSSCDPEDVRAIAKHIQPDYKAVRGGGHNTTAAASAIDYKKEAQRIMNSASRRTGKRPPTSGGDGTSATSRREEAMLITPPRSGRSPRVIKKSNQQQESSSSASSSARPRRLVFDDDDDDDSLLNPKTKSQSSNLSFPGCGGGSSDPGSFVSSIIDWSFSTMGSSKKKDADSAWTFDAVSPVRNLIFSCGGNTSTVDDDSGDAHSVVEGYTAPSLAVDSSGFDADNDNSTIGDDKGNAKHRKGNRKRQQPSATGAGSSGNSGNSSTLRAGDAKALDILPRDALSLASGGAGALLLTEEGLKRHNDKKLQQEQIEPLTLRQQNGVGKLEKEVLKQKVERLQAKEVKKKAETSLQEERAARRIRRLIKARQEEQQVEAAPAKKRRDFKAGHQQQGGSEDDGGRSDVVVVDEEETNDNTSREVTPQKRSSPPRMKNTPDSTSPQTSLGESTASATPTKKSKSGSFLKKVGLPWKKKPTAEQLKRQWKERERQRVVLAQKEKAAAERKEQERIEQLRQSYLEKQRQLERAAAAQPAPPNSRSTSGSEVDVDVIIEQRRQRQQQQQPAYRFNSAAFDDDKTQKQGPSSHLDDYIGNKQYNRSNSATSSNPSVTAGSLPDLGSFSTSMTNPGLGPCIVCQKRERSQIAMPCMHFAFCEHCVKNQTMCPMCTMENVTFSRVNTE